MRTNNLQMVNVGQVRSGLRGRVLHPRVHDGGFLRCLLISTSELSALLSLPSSLHPCLGPCHPYSMPLPFNPLVSVFTCMHDRCNGDIYISHVLIMVEFRRPLTIGACQQQNRSQTMNGGSICIFELFATLFALVWVVAT